MLTKVLLEEERIIELTRRTYDAIADKFAPVLEIGNSSKEEMAAVDLFISKLHDNAVVADLGCGLGKHGRYCAEKGFMVYGFDISTNMIKLAKEYNEKEGYARMEVLQIADMADFENQQKFDAVISAYAFIHLTYEKSKIALKNLHRHLNNHARIFITVYQGDGERVEREILSPQHQLYYRDYKKDEFVELIKSCGYNILEYTEWSDSDPITAGNSDYDAKVLCIIAEYIE